MRIGENYALGGLLVVTLGITGRMMLPKSESLKECARMFLFGLLYLRDEKTVAGLVGRLEGVSLPRRNPGFPSTYIL